MSNLSQFFATGGNKIKKIQRVQATQTFTVASSYGWNGATATISAVDVNKTILVYNTNASNSAVYSFGGIIASYIQYNHYAFLTNSTTVTFNGPNISTTPIFAITPAKLEVQIIEFE